MECEINENENEQLMMSNVQLNSIVLMNFSKTLYCVCVCVCVCVLTYTFHNNYNLSLQDGDTPLYEKL